MQKIYEIGYCYRDIYVWVGSDPYFMAENFDGWEDPVDEYGLQPYWLFLDEETWREKCTEETFGCLVEENSLDEPVEDGFQTVVEFSEEGFRLDIPVDLPRFPELQRNSY